MQKSRSNESLVVIIGVARASYSAGFETAYNNLHEHSKRVFPFIGIVGPGIWTLDTLAAIMQLKRGLIEAGLRQLISIGFVNRISPGRFQASSSLREFALSKLREIGGDALIRNSRALMTQYYLQLNLQTIRRYQMELLSTFLSEESQKQQFLEALSEAASKGDDQSEPLAKANTGLSNFDLVQDVFEGLVIRDPKYISQWSKVLSLQVLSDSVQNLRAALGWAVEQEDWALIRQFSKINSSAYVYDVTVGSKGDGISPANLDVSFALIRNLIFTHSSITSMMRAARIVDFVIAKSEFISADWIAVQLDRPVFSEVDMVGANLLGLAVTNGVFSQVDMRKVDLRGSTFYNCVFHNVNFRNANLNDVELYCPRRSEKKPAQN